jgi:hypothetical protein
MNVPPILESYLYIAKFLSLFLILNSYLFLDIFALLKGLIVRLWKFSHPFLLSFLVAYFEAYSSTLG